MKNKRWEQLSLPPLIKKAAFSGARPPDACLHLPQNCSQGQCRLRDV